MRRYVGITTFCVGLFVAGTALAQTDSSKKGASEKKKKVKSIAKDDRSLVDEDIASLSGDQKLNRAQNKIQKTKKGLKKTKKILKKAREEDKDIQKINCVNDKLAAIKGFLKVAEQSYVKLKNAVSANNSEEAKHHYTLISVSKQKADKLVEEARLCAGDVQRYAAGTKVKMDVDEDDIADPPSYVPQPQEDLFVLPELTPFQ